MLTAKKRHRKKTPRVWVRVDVIEKNRSERREYGGYSEAR